MLIVVSPIVGAIPGPGFIIVFPVGLTLVLRHSHWAKRLYVRIERRWPDYGRWGNWALRRKRQKEMPELPSWREQVRRLFRKRRNG